MEEFVYVVDQEGRRGQIARSELRDEQLARVFVEFDDGQRVLVPREVLTLQNDGSYQLPIKLREQQAVIPVIEEQLKVEKQAIPTEKVRLVKSVHERDVMVDEPLLEEQVDVERVVINRYVDGPVPTMRHEGDTLIVPLLEEVLVIEKRLMVREELHITKRRTETREPQRVTLRREEVNVEQLDVQSGSIDDRSQIDDEDTDRTL